MKLSHQASPGLTCRIVRSWKSIFGSSSLNEGSGSSHIAGCAACQAYFSAADQLEHSLRQGAAVARSSPSDGLDQRIIYAVGRSARTEARAPYFRPALLPFASALVGVAVLALLFSPRPLGPDFSGRLGGPSTVVVPADQSSLEELWSSIPRPAELLKKNPLQEEVDYVYSDAKSALRFLELNFLPVASGPAPARNEGV